MDQQLHIALLYFFSFQLKALFCLVDLLFFAKTNIKYYGFFLSFIYHGRKQSPLALYMSLFDSYFSCTFFRSSLFFLVQLVFFLYNTFITPIVSQSTHLVWKSFHISYLIILSNAFSRSIKQI